jgi:hypothetical protein
MIVRVVKSCKFSNLATRLILRSEEHNEPSHMQWLVFFSMLWWSVADLLQRRVGCDPRPSLVGLVLDKVALGWVIL